MVAENNRSIRVAAGESEDREVLRRRRIMREKHSEGLMEA